MSHPSRARVLPDLPGNDWRGPVVERELVSYPAKAETKAEREARERRGDPAPSGLSYVVGRVLGGVKS